MLAGQEGGEVGDDPLQQHSTSVSIHGAALAAPLPAAPGAAQLLESTTHGVLPFVGIWSRLLFLDVHAIELCYARHACS